MRFRNRLTPVPVLSSAKGVINRLPVQRARGLSKVLARAALRHQPEPGRKARKPPKVSPSISAKDGALPSLNTLWKSSKAYSLNLAMIFWASAIEWRFATMTAVILHSLLSQSLGGFCPSKKDFTDPTVELLEI